MPNSPPSDSDHRRTLERLDRFSYWTDSNIRVPLTNFRFGLSPLIGLIPGIGDFAGLLLSLYVLHEARKIGADRKVQRKIIQNMLIEFFGGLIPVLGDAFDAVYKANTKNTALLRNYIYKEIGEEPPWKFPWFTFIWVSLLILILLAAIYYFM
ncbi:DUF4112 domain-containing protein [Rhodohalobacter sp. SW132]|uniref:DUF4112 domain-containing protein n=1 Tax=Rhodohalobacter sp. SW132 TaxID=2293433 RepID=UPI000E240AA5|nr:DUF4112 domain-containing protein [Rhodohalobacter sp. SW132]REL33496.1 DUF4112 domain-containing protein [Rhodohalobacter sp. SW132]